MKTRTESDKMLFKLINNGLEHFLSYTLEEDYFFKNFLPLLENFDGDEVLEAIETVKKNEVIMNRPVEERHKYLCGVLWNRIKAGKTSGVIEVKKS